MKSQPKLLADVDEEMEFRALLDSANDLIFIISPEARFLYTNQAFQTALGYSEHELRTLGIFDLLHPSCLEKCQRHLQALGQQRAPLPALETEFVTKAGRAITVEGNCSGGGQHGKPEPVRGIFRDVTERDRAQEALRQSEERFRSLIEHSHDAISLFGPDGAILYASPSTTIILGYSPEDLRDRGALEFVRPDWQDAVREQLAESLRSPGVGVPAEACVRHKDGQWRFLEGVFTNLLHVPSVGAIVNNYRDITERKQAEEALLDKEHLLSESQRIAHIGSWFYDPKGKEGRWSEEMYRICGVSPETFAPNAASFLNLIHPEDRSAMQEWTAACLAGKKTGELEFRAILPDGMVRFISAHGELNYSTEKGPAYMTGTAQDITERKRTEAALRESTRQLNSTVNHLAGFVYRCANLPDWPVEYLSQGIFELLGYSAEDFLSGQRTFGSFIAPADRERVWAEVQLGVDARRPFVLEYRVLNTRGEERWVWEKGAGVFDGDKLLALEGFVTDITARKQAEEKLQASSAQLRALSARLQSAREEEGTRIAREIHDELGGALTGLKWDLEEIDKVLSKGVNDGGVEVVREKIPNMTGLIESTIDTVRRISSELRPGVLDDLGLVAAIEWQAQQFQSRTGIKCEYFAGGHEVDLDRERATAVFRIFQEMLTNVIRHAQATRIDIELTERDGQLELRVGDNGRGITEEEMRNTHSLGLLGMRERALLVDGEVSISGRAGRGTTVIARVPVKG